MADKKKSERPLSPHVSIYRPQLTSIASILTRVTGVALLVGGLLVVCWFLSAASSAESFATFDGLLTSWFGDLVMLGSLWALWFHLLTGLRHLIWDAGYGLELATAEMLGWGAVAGSVILTAITVAII